MRDRFGPLWPVPLLAAAFAATVAHAQDRAQSHAAAERRDEIAPDTDGETAAEPVFVTARRRSEDASEVPVSVAVLDSASLDARGVRSQADLQVSIPGLVARQAGGNGDFDFVMRGETVDADSGAPPGVQPYFNEVPFQLVAATPLYDLESVQAVRGPQGTLFGRNATGGAVLFQAQPPREDFGGHAFVQYGNFDRLIAEAALNVPLVADALLVRVAGTVSSGGAFVRNLYDGRLLGNREERSVRVSVLVRPDAGFSNLATVQVGKVTGSSTPDALLDTLLCEPGGKDADCARVPGGNPFFTDLVEGSLMAGLADGQVYSAGFAQLPGYLRGQGRYVVSANAPFSHRATSMLAINRTTLAIAGRVQLRNILGLAETTLRYRHDPDLSPFPIAEKLASGNAALNGAGAERERSRALTNELQLEGLSADENWSVLGGLFLARSREWRDLPPWVTGLADSPGLTAVRTGSFTRALFAQASYQVTPRLGLTGGWRHTWERVTLRHRTDDTQPSRAALKLRQSDPSWTLSADYRFNDDMMIYGATRGSWRRGGFNPYASLVATDEPFRAQKVRDVEMGVKFDGFAGPVPLRANLTGYYSRVRNIQKSGYRWSDDVLSPATVNIARARIRGLEGDFSVRPVDWLTIGGSATVTDGRYGDAKGNRRAQSRFGPFRDVPKFAGAIQADFNVELPRGAGLLNWRVDLYRQSSVAIANAIDPLEPAGRLPGYALVNMRVDWIDMLETGLKSSIFVKNLTGRVYYTGGTAGADGLPVETAVFGAPRTYGVSLRTDF